MFVKLVAADDTEYPLTEYCYSSTPGSGYEVYPNGALDQLSFTLPPLVPGVYHILFKYGFKLSKEIEFKNAITVMRRNRSKETARVRSNLPPFYKTGPRRVRDERSLTPYPSVGATGASEEYPLNPLEGLLHAFGQASQLLSGNLVTRLTSSLAPDATTANVESTLAFPSKGTVWIGRWRYVYTAKTATALTGLSQDQKKSVDYSSRILTIKDKTEVILDSRSIFPD